MFASKYGVGVVRDDNDLFVIRLLEHGIEWSSFNLTGGWLVG